MLGLRPPPDDDARRIEPLTPAGPLRAGLAPAAVEGGAGLGVQRFSTGGTDNSTSRSIRASFRPSGTCAHRVAMSAVARSMRSGAVAPNPRPRQHLSRSRSTQRRRTGPGREPESASAASSGCGWG